MILVGRSTNSGGVLYLRVSEANDVRDVEHKRKANDRQKPSVGWNEFLVGWKYPSESRYVRDVEFEYRHNEQEDPKHRKDV